MRESASLTRKRRPVRNEEKRRTKGKKNLGKNSYNFLQMMLSNIQGDKPRVCNRFRSGKLAKGTGLENPFSGQAKWRGPQEKK